MLLTMNSVDFGYWLQAEREKKGWSQSDLARSSGLHRAVISKVESGTKPMPETLTALAKALDISPITIFRKVGILPPQSPESELINRIIHLTSDLPEEDQTDILEYVMLRNRIAQERGKHETKGTGKSATKLGKA